MTRRVGLALRIAVVLALLGTLAGLAFARPGGGESYSGGGGHGGGGGGFGGGGGGGGGGDGGAIFELIYWTIRLCFYYPQIGIPLVGGIVAWIAWSAYKQHQNKDWDSGPPVALERAIDLQRVRALDPDFSQIVFEDFAFRLFSAAHRARSSPESIATVGPYVARAARDALLRREPGGEPVQQVIVGAMRVFRADVPEAARDALDRPTRVRIGIEYEANVATANATYYSVESWLFGRDAARTSKPPDPARIYKCPNCGAPWQATSTGTQQCANCGQIVDNGRFDWVVEQISLASLDERPPTLTTEVPERGTDLSTYVQPGVRDRLAALHRDDPEVAQPALSGRLQLIYDAMTDAWSKNELAPIRGLVSDGLYDYLAYWVDAYKRQGLRNALVDMRITRTELAKITRDRWYDAITYRVWATGKDYVVRGDDVVRGSRHRERPYSEYWTLIRSAARKGPVKTDRTCGNCGAPLEVTMAGACSYCGAHVTAGEFDWVLSKIEQDDSYRG